MWLASHTILKIDRCLASSAECSLGEQYSALLTACCIAERVRDKGGHSLVVLDDIGCMVRLWEMITRAIADLGPRTMLQIEGGASAQSADDIEEGELVEYEGMLVSLAAAQRRRCV